MTTLCMASFISTLAPLPETLYPAVLLILLKFKSAHVTPLLNRLNDSPLLCGEIHSAWVAAKYPGDPSSLTSYNTQACLRWNGLPFTS